MSVDAPVSPALAARLDRVRGGAMAAGAVGLVGCLAGFFTNPGQLLQSYLFAFLFWSGIAIGCLSLLMLQHLTGGRWGLLIRRFLEAGTRTFPVLLVLFLPILLGREQIYVWARAEEVASDAVIAHKALYLSWPFWTGRALFYFACWIGLSTLLNRWSIERDRTRDPRLSERLQGLSGAGLVLQGLTVTFASIDWSMSIDPHWFSTIYGMLFMVGQVLSAMALCIVCVAWLGEEEPLAPLASRQTVHDLGKLMLAFVMLWAYTALSQFLIIWSGNLPEEIPWYLRRLQGGWQFVGLVLVLFHFALPFLLLLSRSLKRNPRLLGNLALAMLVVRLVDLFWLVRPEFRGPGNLDGLTPALGPHWLDLAAPIAVGGIWLTVFLRELGARPLVSVGDPELEEALAGAHGH